MWYVRESTFVRDIIHTELTWNVLLTYSIKQTIIQIDRKKTQHDYVQGEKIMFNMYKTRPFTGRKWFLFWSKPLRNLCFRVVTCHIFWFWWWCITPVPFLIGNESVREIIVGLLLGFSEIDTCAGTVGVLFRRFPVQCNKIFAPSYLIYFLRITSWNIYHIQYKKIYN